MRNCVKIYPIEIITYVWIFLTGIFIMLFPCAVRESTVADLLLARLFVITGFVALILIDCATGWKWIKYSRQMMPLILITYWYPETYYYNQAFFVTIDPWLIDADQWLCGFQPSTLFSEWIPAGWFNELMNFSYISFFLALFLIHIYFLKVDLRKAFMSAFVLLCSFFMYYLFFIVLPAEGPQYFVFCHDTAIPVKGAVRELLLWLHHSGERPTGAIPSSHVGVMMVYMYILWRNGRTLFWWLLPFSILLLFSTIYIKAHYLVDIIAGALLSYPAYIASKWLWIKLNDALQGEVTVSRKKRWQKQMTPY